MIEIICDSNRDNAVLCCEDSNYCSYYLSVILGLQALEITSMSRVGRHGQSHTINTTTMINSVSDDANNTEHDLPHSTTQIIMIPALKCVYNVSLSHHKINLVIIIFFILMIMIITNNRMLQILI